MVFVNTYFSFLQTLVLNLEIFTLAYTAKTFTRSTEVSQYEMKTFNG